MTESPPTEATADALRDQVRERYAKIASTGSCCSIPDAGASGGCETGGSGGCCGEGSSSALFGYSTEEIAALPAGADLGLGCGRPIAFADLRPGEVVLDLGSGAGADCFLAGVKVGGSGHVIGVDMTPEMLARARARELGRSSGRENVEFRLGEIEHLPVANASVDVVLSNRVINLVPDKGRVYREAFRVLRPGGRLAIADVLATRPIPEEMRDDRGRWSSCSSGALTRDEVTERLRAAGFASIDVSFPGGGPAPRSLGAQEEIGVVSAEVRATKPGSPGP